MKAFAGSAELAGEAISTHTVYGVVTLSGTVPDEARRAKAETLAANAVGVKKVVDELQLQPAPDSETPGAETQAQHGEARPLVLQSDGSYAPAEQGAPPAAETTTGSQHPAPGSAPAAAAQRNDPDNDQVLDQQAQDPNQPATTPGGSPLPPNDTRSVTYPPSPYRNPRRNLPPAGAYALSGQPEGRPVVVPGGSLLQVRMDRTLASDRTPAGTSFTGTVVADVVADGYVAIPRGASVSGSVVEAEKSGTLKGRGELSVTLDSVTLGGHVYPLTTDPWMHHGGDKTVETVNKTAGFGAAGAVIGALAGGGVGAAVGGGIGAAAGLGSSAASGNGQVVVPAESVVAFRLAQPAALVTVSQQEMQRLAYSSYPQQAPGYERPRRRIYAGPLYPAWGRGYPYPGYYPGYYPPPPPYYYLYPSY